MTKAIYRVKNWSLYNKSLINRGSINLWIDDEVVDNWFYNRSAKMSVGSPIIYSDTAIELCLILRSLYKILLRMTQGFMESFFTRANLSNLRCPNYSTISRRGKKLGINLKRYQNIGDVTDIVIDSTGLKAFGEGEWKVRLYKADKRRSWRKLHIAADPLSNEILAAELSNSKEMDDSHFKPLIAQIKETVERAFADGAYDRVNCYEVCDQENITPIIPPQKKALLQEELQNKNKKTDCKRFRDNNINRIRNLEQTTGNQEEARKEWKIESDYHQRSIAENVMFRFKKTFTDRLLSSNFDNQKTESLIKINILNRFTALGMPDS